MTENPRCLVIKQAEERVSEIKAHDLPTDFDPGDMSYNEILAHVRHEFTNYEALLFTLPPCAVLWGHREYGCIQKLGSNVSENDCPWEQEAHDLLKWAAKGAAEEVYQAWLKTR